MYEHTTTTTTEKKKNYFKKEKISILFIYAGEIFHGCFENVKTRL